MGMFAWSQAMFQSQLYNSQAFEFFVLASVPFLPTTSMLRVSFFPVPECVVSDCWKRPFRTPSCHPSPVIIVIVLYLGCLRCMGYMGCQGCQGCQGCLGCRGCQGCQGCQGRQGRQGCLGCLGCRNVWRAWGAWGAKGAWGANTKHQIPNTE